MHLKFYALSISFFVMLSAVSMLMAHEIPERVQTKVLIQETEQTLQVLIRVPLEAMRDFDFPVKGPGYLDVAQAESLLQDAAMLWVVDEFKVFEHGVALMIEPDILVRVSLPNDKSFDNFAEAFAHMASPPPAGDVRVFWRQALLDIQVTYKTSGASKLNSQPVKPSDFSIDSNLGHLGQRTSTSLKFINLDGEEYYYDFTGNPGLLILAPDWYQVVAEFVARGVAHIWEGIDHILFLFCLILPIRKPRTLIWVVTAFTAGHSLTLVAAVSGFIPDLIWFPAAVEFLIAVSVVVMALDNILGRKFQRRWLFGFGFGLVHGFGFSFALAETLQFSGGHLVIALLGFNVGVELGQLALLVVILPVLGLVFRYMRASRNAGSDLEPMDKIAPSTAGNNLEEQTNWMVAGNLPAGERLLVWVLSALVAHSALHWTADQWSLLVGYF